MRILHLADFHFKSSSQQYEQKNIVEKLIKSLSEKEKIDLLFFTGDLVFSGKNFSDFESAHNLLIAKISEESKIDLKNIFVCPGNHEINRDNCSEAIIKLTDGFHGEKDIETFIKKNKNDLKTSFAPLNNYYKYVGEKIKNEFITKNEFLTSSVINIGNKNIGIISINSAWLSSGFRDDLNNLFFPTSLLKEAYENIRKKCDFKILLTHHPLNYFKEFNYNELENFIHGNFDLLFCGHIHKEQIKTHYTASNGIYCNSSQATLSPEDNAEIGYSIVDIDFDFPGQIKLERAHFLKKSDAFIPLETIIIDIPCGEEKHKQNRIRNKITAKFQVELEEANKLLVDYPDDEKKNNFLDQFSPPVLSKSTEAEASGNGKNDLITIEEIIDLEDNFILYGYDKSGKTSLLKKLQLYYLKNYSSLGVVPFYIDYKDFEEDEIDLEKLIASYYEINREDARRIVDNKNFTFLIDNLTHNHPLHSKIEKFLDEHSFVRFIATSDYLISRLYVEKVDDRDYKKLYFKSLTRKEIRVFTEKKREIKAEEREVVLERISHLCKQMQLPVNYWTISLLLLIYRRSSDDYHKNLFSVLDLCVDEILQKKRLLFTKSNITFEQYKELCGKIINKVTISVTSDSEYHLTAQVWAYMHEKSSMPH